MHDSITTVKESGLVDTLGRSLSTSIKPAAVKPAATADALHPLDDPAVWRNYPMHEHPGDIDIVQAQKWLDSLMGQTRGQESIYKLVWSGDRKYWHEFYTEWDSFGIPKGEPMRRPRLRAKTLRDGSTGRLLRDAFPPRWIILARLEPEQYADTWEKESFYTDSVCVGHKQDIMTGGFTPEYRTVSVQIRPSTPPPVFYMWYTTVMNHSNFCCAVADGEKRKCFGNYGTPYSFRHILENQRAADLQSKMNPFAKVDMSFVREIEEENNGYQNELQQLVMECEAFKENPNALLGTMVDVGPAQAKQMVTDYYDRQIQALSQGAK